MNTASTRPWVSAVTESKPNGLSQAHSNGCRPKTIPHRQNPTIVTYSKASSAAWNRVDLESPVAASKATSASTPIPMLVVAAVLDAATAQPPSIPMVRRSCRSGGACAGPCVGVGVGVGPVGTVGPFTLGGELMERGTPLLGQ